MTLAAMIVFMVMVTTLDTKAQTVPVWKLADLQTAMDTANGPTVINFWATFCKPCIAEMPHFQAAADRYKTRGLKLILVSLDLKEAYPKGIQTFIRKRNVSAPVVYLDESNADRFLPAVDSTWSGSIPATLFINRSKGYRHFYEEELSKEKLEAEIRKLLQ